jgi:hypothetical protein
MYIDVQYGKVSWRKMPFFFKLEFELRTDMISRKGDSTA